MPTYLKMADSKPTFASIRQRLSFPLIISYALDWIILIAIGVVSVVLGNLEPNKRPFSLSNPDISCVPSEPSGLVASRHLLDTLLT